MGNDASRSPFTTTGSGPNRVGAGHCDAGLLPRRAEIKRMRVDPRLQRRGFGRLILERLEARAGGGAAVWSFWRDLFREAPGVMGRAGPKRAPPPAGPGASSPPAAPARSAR